jgi:hypothetical protein
MVKANALLPTDKAYAQQNKDRAQGLAGEEAERVNFMNQTGPDAFNLTQTSFLGATTNNVIQSMNQTGAFGGNTASDAMFENESIAF